MQDASELLFKTVCEQLLFQRSGGQGFAPGIHKRGVEVAVADTLNVGRSGSVSVHDEQPGNPECAGKGCEHFGVSVVHSINYGDTILV